jgi:hypothetical protein
MKQDQLTQLIARVAGNIYGNFYQQYVTDVRIGRDVNMGEVAQVAVTVAADIVLQAHKMAHSEQFR